MRNPTSAALFRIWWQTAARHARHDWWQTLTLVLILALGVASFLSIRLANRAALAGFAGLQQAVAGQSDWTLRAPTGTLDEVDLPAMAAATVGQPVALVPLLEGSALDARDRRELRLLATDLLAVDNLPGAAGPSALIQAGPGGDLWEFLRDTRGVLIAPALAENQGLAVGDHWPVYIQGREVGLHVRGILPPNRLGVEMPANLVVLDLPHLQNLLERPTAIDRVEVILTVPEAQKTTWREPVRAALDQASAGRWQVRSPASEQLAGAQMTAALRMNLDVLSLISLLVGLFLIAQAIDAAVVRRRREIGILRSLGLTPAHIRQLWRLDLLALGLTGGALGLLLGWGLAQVAVRAVARTVNALYVHTTASSASLTPLDALFGLALGLGATWLAGQIPLRDAASTPPAQVMRGGRFGDAFPLWRQPLWGVALLLGGVGAALLPPWTLADQTRLPVGGFVAAFAWLIGGTIVAGAILRPLATALLRLPIDHFAWKVALVQLREATSRHRLALAGLFVAVGMAASISVLVGSFAKTMEDWIAVRLQADLYVSLAGESGPNVPARLPASLWQPIAAHPDVEAVNIFDLQTVTYRGGPTYLAGSDLTLLGTYEDALWIERPLALDRQPAEATAYGYINESFARRFGHRVGEVVTLATPAGERRIWLRGLVADYGNDRGSLVVPLEMYQAWVGHDRALNLSLHLRDPARADALAAELRQAYPGLEIRSNGALRTTVLTIFRQTFAATDALRLLGVAIALVGLALGLVSILRENRASLRTLRTLGATRHDLALVAALESAGLTLGGLLGGQTLSLALGWVMIYVINRQSFGWTLRYAYPWADVLGFSLAVLTLGTLIGYLVGRASARLALEEEMR